MSPDLRAATNRLDVHVQELIGQMHVQELQARRIKRALVITMVALILAIIGLIGTGYTTLQARHAASQGKHAAGVAQAAVEVNKASQVVNCENGNESRSANLALWTFLVSQSKAQTHKEVVALQAIQDYVNQLFALHDCQHLEKKYPLPPPPLDLGLNK